MNDSVPSESVPAELKLFVERTVRPVRCSLLRKRRMRDELLAHLLSIYQAELTRTGSETKALREAERRCGQPSEITPELQSSVSRWDALRRLLECSGWEPGESIGHLIARHLLLISAAYAAAFLLVLPLLVARRGISELALTAHVLLVMALVTAAFSSAFVLLADRIGCALYGQPHERSNRACTRYCAIALAILPGMMTMIHLGLGLGVPSLATWGWTALVAPLMPLLLLLIAPQAAAESRYEQDWAALDASIPESQM